MAWAPIHLGFNCLHTDAHYMEIRERRVTNWAMTRGTKYPNLVTALIDQCRSPHQTCCLADCREASVAVARLVRALLAMQSIPTQRDEKKRGSIDLFQVQWNLKYLHTRTKNSTKYIKTKKLFGLSIQTHAKCTQRISKVCHRAGKRIKKSWALFNLMQINEIHQTIEKQIAQSGAVDLHHGWRARPSCTVKSKLFSFHWHSHLTEQSHNI